MAALALACMVAAALVSVGVLAERYRERRTRIPAELTLRSQNTALRRRCAELQRELDAERSRRAPVIRVSPLHVVRGGRS